MYNFPVISHIDDILPVIKDKPEFLVIEKDGYTVIDYVFTTPDTFPMVQTVGDAMLRECRGLIFDKITGKVIARRLHKFFNVNEREETLVKNIDFSEPHIILEKLDGSQITPFITSDGVLHWGTKKGETEISEQIKSIDLTQYEVLANRMSSFTLIFEWCSRKQRIVIDHKEDQLVLIAARHNLTGDYVSYLTLAKIAQIFKIPIVRAFKNTTESLAEFVEMTRKETDIEGYVIRFNSGHMLKVKADWYVEIHQTKDLINHEPRVVSLVLDEVVDDVLPLLVMDIDKERVLKYQTELRKALITKAYMLNVDLKLYKMMMTRKEFALNVAPKMNQVQRSLYFACWDNPAKEFQGAEFMYQTMRKMIKSCLTNATKFAKIKEALFTEVKYEN